MKHAICIRNLVVLFTLSLALAACKSPRENPTDASENEVSTASSAETAQPSPSKAEASHHADETHAASAQPVPDTTARQLEDLHGTWVLDGERTAARLSPEQRAGLKKILDNTAMSITFEDDGRMVTDGAAMGAPQQYQGTYALEHAENNVLILRVQPDDTTNERGEVIKKGIPQTIEATFVDDMHLRWMPAAEDGDSATPHTVQGMVFTRDADALKGYDAQLERARVPRTLDLEDLQ